MSTFHEQTNQPKLFRILVITLVLLVSAAQGSCQSNAPSSKSTENRADSDINEARAAKLRAYLEKYWDNIDVDTLSEQDREQHLVDYIYLTTNADEATRRQCWQTIARVIPDEQPNRMVCDYLGETDSPLYAPAMLDEYLETLTTLFADGSVERVRIDYLLGNLRKNRPGSVIADLDLVVTTDGTRTTLHKLIAQSGTDTQILFYDPECEECAATISRLTNEYRTVIAISVTGIAMPTSTNGSNAVSDSQRSSADVGTKTLPAEWHSCIAIDMDQLDENYYLPTLPRLYTVTPTAQIKTAQ